MGTYLLDMLEPIHYKGLQGQTVEDFIVIDVDFLEAGNALDLAEQYEGVQTVVREDQLLQLGELSQLLEVGMVDYQVEPNVGQVKLFHYLVELLALKDFQSVPIDVQYLV